MKKYDDYFFHEADEMFQTASDTHKPRARQIIFVVAIVLFASASIYTNTLPLPKTFDFANYFSVLQG